MLFQPVAPLMDFGFRNLHVHRPSPPHEAVLALHESGNPVAAEGNLCALSVPLFKSTRVIFMKMCWLRLDKTGTWNAASSHLTRSTEIEKDASAEYYAR